METLAIALLAGVGFIVAYHTYGRWLGGKIFALSAQAICPSEKYKDGVDYVPTDKGVVFGHHFTSIAGTGPIVGPAIAVMWGWVPALLWVVLGSIFIGAVHDFGALVVSLRNKGQTVGDVAGRVMKPRVRLLFLSILFMALTIVLAIFGLVIAAVFKQYPAAIFPCIIQIPIAVTIGVMLHRKGVNLLLPSLAALGVMYLTVIFGNAGPLGAFNQALAGWSIMTWVVVLLVYSYVASVLPVWTLLQPRDYINSLQLISALALIVLGLFAAAFAGGAPVAEGIKGEPLAVAAPAFDMAPAGAPFIFPFLFITIACGACSGFHCLVSSGTSSKQLKSEPDARFVGYGGMLTEGFLATLVIVACCAGLGLGSHAKFGAEADSTISATLIDKKEYNIARGNSNSFIVTETASGTVTTVTADSATTFSANGLTFDYTGATAGVVLTGKAAWNNRYASWGTAKGLGAKVGAFVDGAANFLKSLGLPAGIAVALMGVLVASFAGTTLDTACRLQRYVIQELAATLSAVTGGKKSEKGELTGVWGTLANKHGATVFAVTLAVAVAAAPVGSWEGWTWATAGKGGLLLWPLFGATNQLLAGLALMVIFFYLWRRDKPIWFISLPMIFMLIMPVWAMSDQLFIGEASWIAQKKWLLVGIGLATIALEIWMIIEAFLLVPKVRGVLEESALEAEGNPAQMSSTC
ncbi:MAG: carbon starvation protein A [Verrucomicrobiales bacterium]|nr:carbon starvation protein A [Verrucomicrobiales bacterium]|tara:strand:+ start:2723 stop:4801 length:2079 start_codon:yes stop_codon:yes gene_type:complete